MSHLMIIDPSNIFEVFGSAVVYAVHGCKGGATTILFNNKPSGGMLTLCNAGGGKAGGGVHL